MRATGLLYPAEIGEAVGTPTSPTWHLADAGSAGYGLENSPCHASIHFRGNSPLAACSAVQGNAPCRPDDFRDWELPALGTLAWPNSNANPGGLSNFRNGTRSHWKYNSITSFLYPTTVLCYGMRRDVRRYKTTDTRPQRFQCLIDRSGTWSVVDRKTGLPASLDGRLVVGRTRMDAETVCRILETIYQGHLENPPRSR